MVYNDNPLIRNLELLSEKHGFDRAVVIGIHKNEDFEIASWGKTQKLCSEIKPFLFFVEKELKSFYKTKGGG